MSMRLSRMSSAVPVALLLCGQAVLGADVVSDWNQIMVATVAGQNPFAQARLAAITQLAVFEAANAITREYRPYLGTIEAPPDASAEAAVVAAAHGVLKNYFPAAAATLDSARAASLAGIADGPAKTAGIAAGEAAAAAMIARRADDGSAPPEFYMPPNNEPGQWQPTPSCTAAGGVLLHWRKLMPFGVPDVERFRSDPPPSLSSVRYARDYNEVGDVGSASSSTRPEDRADVARFYAATSAVAAWNPAAMQVAAAKETGLTELARVLALLNMAMSDALVASMETKYHYNFWRPETAIRSGDLDGNSRTEPLPTFAPYIITPCFPSYPSAHASAGYAALEVLQGTYGNGGHSITLSNAAVSGVVLKYSRLREITGDIDDARVFGGIHFRFDQEAGAEQGRRVGAYVLRNNLQRLLGCPDPGA